MSYRCQASRLEIIADSDPTLLARVFAIFGGLSLIPARVEAVAGPVTGLLHITIHIHSGTVRQLDLIQRKLAQLTSIQRVRFDASDAVLCKIRRSEFDTHEERTA